MTCTCGHINRAHQWRPHRYAECTVCLLCHQSSDQHDFVNHDAKRCGCNQYEARNEP